MRRVICILPALAVFLLLVGCPNAGSPGTAASGVYVAGYYNDGSNDIAAYWVDGVKTDLDVPLSATGSRATGIFVDGSDVHVCGYYVDGVSNPTYWLNGARTDLSGTGEATGIFVSGGTVYISGSEQSGTPIPVYWVDGTREDLRAAVAGATANEVVVKSGVPFAVGDYEVLGPPYAQIWRDTAVAAPDETALTADRSEALDITIDGSGNFVVAGSYFNTSDNPASVYWTIVDSATLTPIRQELHDDATAGNWSKAYGVDESAGTIFSAGYYRTGGFAGPETAAYWENTTKFDLPGATNAQARDITVESGVIFVVGYYTDSGSRVAVIWQDGVATDLYNSAGVADAEALDIFVMP